MKPSEGISSILSVTSSVLVSVCIQRGEDSSAQTDSRDGTGADSDSDSNSDTDTDTDADSDVDTNSNTDTDTNTDTDMDSDAITNIINSFNEFK